MNTSRPVTRPPKSGESSAGQPARGRLMQSILLHIAACLKECDRGSVERLNLSADQKARIATMSAADLLRLSDVGRQCVTFAINPRALDEALALVDQRRRRDELIERCIRQDAPRAMMSTFFGLSRRRYAALRAVHDMPAIAGRCPRPSPDIEHAIYQRWIAARKSWTPITLVEIAESVGIPLRIVWDQLLRLRDWHVEA